MVNYGIITQIYNYSNNLIFFRTILYKAGCMMNKEQLEKYLQKNPFEQIKNIVFDLISEEIISLRLKPGENLNISKIAEDLNISITPVREAIVKLIDYGFIKRYPYKKGYFVSDFDIDDITKVFYARVAIESKAAYLCAQYKECPNIDRLAELAENFKNSSYNYDISAANDLEFHSLLVLSSGNNYLIEFFNAIVKRAWRYQRFILLNVSKNNNSVNPYLGSYITQHTAVVNAIKQNMPEVAEKEMANHINLGMQNILFYYNLNLK